MSPIYYDGYPNEPIGGGNPYYMCSSCKLSDPQINGKIENHLEWCEYRLKKEKELNPSSCECNAQKAVSEIITYFKEGWGSLDHDEFERILSKYWKEVDKDGNEIY